MSLTNLQLGKLGPYIFNELQNDFHNLNFSLNTTISQKPIFYSFYPFSWGCIFICVQPFDERAMSDLDP